MILHLRPAIMPWPPPCYNRGMDRTLETRYRGVDLALDIGRPHTVTLRINGITRDRADGAGANVTLRVNSTVQTDYEWHEFIEGIVTFDGGGATARIVANNLELARQHYPDKESS